jgi:hypothetical protein
LSEFAHEKGAPEISAVFRRAIDKDPSPLYGIPMRNPDDVALKYLRMEAADSGIPEIRELYIAVLVKLRNAHLAMMGQLHASGWLGSGRMPEEGLSTTLRDLEWEIQEQKRKAKKGTK